MPLGDRLYRVAARGCLILGLALVPSNVPGQPRPQTEQAERQKAESEQPSIFLDASSLKPMFDEWVRIRGEEKTAGEASEQRREWREESDLIAQQGMARWAMILVILTSTQLIVAFFTLIYLWKTFKATRVTAQAAVDSAGAAQQSTVVAQHHFERTQRPYIAIFDVMILSFHPGIIVYDVGNFGTTPASIKEAYVGTWTATDLPPPTLSKVGPRHRLTISDVIRPGNQLNKIQEVFPKNVRFTQGGLDIPPNEKIYMQIIIKYEGPFSGPHQTGGLWVYSVKDNAFSRVGGDQYNYIK